MVDCQNSDQCRRKMQVNNNRNAVIAYTVICLLILFASIYVVRYSGFRLQNLMSNFDGKSPDEDLSQTDSLEERLQKGGDELLAYIEKLAQDENSVLINGDGSVKGDRAGYGDDRTQDVLGDAPGRIQVTYSEFGKNNNSRYDLTSNALNNIKRSYLNIVGVKKEEAEAAKNAHLARLQQMDEKMLSSKEKQWKIEEEKRRKKRVISRRGAASEGQDKQSELLRVSNGTNFIGQFAKEDVIGRDNRTSMQKKNFTNNSNPINGKTTILESYNREKEAIVQNTCLGALNALETNKLQQDDSIRTRSLEEPKILSLPNDIITAMLDQEPAFDQRKRMMKREEAANLESEQRLKATTTPCVPKDPGSPTNRGRPEKTPGSGKSDNPATRQNVDGGKNPKATESDSTKNKDSTGNSRTVEVDSEGDDIAAAKLINGFMQSVMDQASKIGNLKSELGLGRKSDVEYQSFTNINKTVTNEFMSNVFGCVDKLVENTLARQVCGQLPPDMKRFLDWLLKSGVSKEQACQVQKARGEADFANFVFSAAGALKNETRNNNADVVGLDVDEEELKFLSDGNDYLKDTIQEEFTQVQ